MMNNESKIIIKRVDIEGSLFSGQSFRWHYKDNRKKEFYGVIGDDFLTIERKKKSEYILSCTKKTINGKNINDFVRQYFSLDINTKSLFSCEFRRRFPDVWKLAQPYLGIKILRQNAFETLVTFMCAQGIGMKIIRKQVTYLAKEFGKKHTITLNNKPFVYHSFPSPESLASANPESLRICTNNNCIRANNIIEAAKNVASGKLDLEALKDPEMSLETARMRLCAHPGIGYKIADCILLFGLHRFSAFPIDTHVRQYLAAWFSAGEALQSLTRKHYLLLQEQASRILSPELAGFAGHILFHCWRKEVKRLDSY